MACKKSTLTNNLSRSSVISFTRCSDSLKVTNYEVSPNETINLWYDENSFNTAFTNQVLTDTINWPPAPTNSFTITSSRVINEGAFGAIFSDVGTTGYTMTDNQNNQLWPAYYFNISDNDADILNVFSIAGIPTNNEGYMFNVTWGPGSTSSTLVKVSYNDGGKQMYILAVDPTNTDWQINNSIQGTPLVGTFLFPATFTPYYPITDKNSWC